MLLKEFDNFLVAIVITTSIFRWRCKNVTQMDFTIFLFLLFPFSFSFFDSTWRLWLRDNPFFVFMSAKGSSHNPQWFNLLALMSTYTCIPKFMPTSCWPFFFLLFLVSLNRVFRREFFSFLFWYLSSVRDIFHFIHTATMITLNERKRNGILIRMNENR